MGIWVGGVALVRGEMLLQSCILSPANPFRPLTFLGRLVDTQAADSLLRNSKVRSRAKLSPRTCLNRAKSYSRRQQAVCSTALHHSQQLRQRVGIKATVDFDPRREPRSPDRCRVPQPRSAVALDTSTPSHRKK